MANQIERIAILEERVENIDEKITEVSTDVKSISVDVSAMREMLATYKGASGVIKYVTHAATGIVAALIGMFATTKH